MSYQIVSSYENIICSKKSLKFLYANARSIVKPGKLDELRCVVKSFTSTLHVIVLTETWIKSEDEARQHQITGYYHYYNYRRTRGGGVSIFIHQTLKHCLIEEKCINENHYLWIHIENYSLDIGAVYRTGDFNTFLDTYSAQLNERKRGVTFGDFNINLLISERTTKLYKDILKENDYKIVNKIDESYCTRETAKTKTLIDHVCTNLKDSEFHFAIIETPMSDHKQIYFEIKRYKQKPLQKINYQAIDYNKLYTILKNDQRINEDYLYNLLEDKLIASIKNSKTMKTKILNPPKQDWINKTIINEINIRNTLWYDHKRNPKDIDKKQVFTKKRNEVTEVIQAFNNYFSNIGSVLAKQFENKSLNNSDKPFNVPGSSSATLKEFTL